ncbi:uncharacterized protein LOC109843474 isoform X2 [Asparagus officinalis]|uniref:uncharacterized protein LOC109843474 isoform X2 n=1 Tax=Asparagus officinalis TaxID=4686 RepID=UPI00098E43EA|nr:uncharacterized protein LOC109843474 isoform X2 [Asparagus officinalis]
MATIKIRPSQFLSSSKLRLFPNPNPSFKSICTLTIPPLKGRGPSKARARVDALELKENWLDSLSCPFPSPGSDSSGIKDKHEGSGGKWVVGIDPDVSGALALLKDDDDDDAQVFDSPHLQVLVGNKVRKRLDVRSIVQLLRSFGAPLGTKAFIEQSTPYPQDGKQGWWSGGFTYGLWIGILVSSGFSVVPVSSRLWKDQFQLSRSSSSKVSLVGFQAILWGLSCIYLCLVLGDILTFL